MDVADLMVHLHESVDSIHRSMHALTDTSAHDAEVARLEEMCELRVQEHRGRHEELRNQIEERRQKEEEEIKGRRLREELEIMERRRREDEERRRRLEREEQQREREKMEEDERRSREREEGERDVKKVTEEEIERLEVEMRKRWEQGRARVRELDEKRKVCSAFSCRVRPYIIGTNICEQEINRKIDEMLSLPMEFPNVQTRRRENQSSKKTSISRLSFHSPQKSPCRDAMLDRLWNGEKYICERYFQGPLRPNPMLRRLWSANKYPVHLYFGPHKDPMLDRLWNGESYGSHTSDPMLERLWNGERYSQSTATRIDPMLRRLWSDTRYSHEQYVFSRRDPMMERLWSNKKYPHEKYISTKFDPMLSRLWNGERYGQQIAPSHRDDPMMARLWSSERYMTSGHQDPMLARLWNGERYTNSGQLVEVQDPMMKRLWAATRYREDPMITRLWAAVRYREDPMLDRLWNGESYYSEEETEFELNNVLWVSEPAIKSPIPRSPIPTNLYNLDVKYPSHHVSEFRDSSDDEEDGIDNIINSSKRHSGVFTAFFNSIKTDIPLVNDYLQNQEYANVPDDDDFDEFVAQPLLFHAPNEQHVHFEDLLEERSESRVHEYAYSSEHEEDVEISSQEGEDEVDEEEEEEFPFRNDTSGLRIQTTSLPILSDTPHAGLSFENLTQFPSSGAPSSPATPSDTASHAFQELHHGSVSSISIPTSWSPPREELHLALASREAKKQDEATSQFVSYIPPNSDMIPSGEGVGQERERPTSKRGVSGYFNNVPQNPRLSRDLGRMFGGFKGDKKEDEEREEGRSDRRALLGRLSKMAGGLYYGGTGEEKGRLLGE
jgi:hypothetical protein